MSSDKNTKVRRQRSISQVHYGFKNRQDDAEQVPKPHFTIGGGSANPCFEKYECQVAGHQFTGQKTCIGLLKSRDRILKPIIKPETHRREILFYEEIKKTSRTNLKELRQFIPQYYGMRTINYNGNETEFLILEDVTHGMLEPSIIDIKIGRQTWDPLASESKVERERIKYGECKRDVAFCVPGFQVYKLATGRLHKYNKEYGRKLNGETVREALKTFLNINGQKICRSLILQFLTELWKIQKWASKQTDVKLYASSLLLAYDTKCLRECCGQEEFFSVQSNSKCITPVVRKRSLFARRIYSAESIPSNTNFSGQLSQNGPVFKKISSPPTTSMKLAQEAFAPVRVAHSDTTWHSALQALKRSHSFHNNYEENLSKLKLSYNSILDDLTSENARKSWVTVKIIDFVHSFFSEDDNTVDKNFFEGINNVVKIFEELLHETELQLEVYKV